eukprot:m51a1_g10259 putative domain containing protein (239) ;mRNA; r:240-1857
MAAQPPPLDRQTAAAAQRTRRRRFIVDEILSTEEDYVRDLDVLEDVWRAGLAREGLLSAQEQRIVFGSIPQIRFLATELAMALREDQLRPDDAQRIGDTFAKKVPFFRLYIEYCYNRRAAAEIVGRLGSNPRYAAFKEQARGDPRTKQLELNGFLIKPTQRIAKYPLFLKDLLKYTDPSHGDYKNLEAAQESMLKVLGEINERTREQESASCCSRPPPRASAPAAPALPRRPPATCCC